MDTKENREQRSDHDGGVPAIHEHVAAFVVRGWERNDKVGTSAVHEEERPTGHVNSTAQTRSFQEVHFEASTKSLSVWWASDRAEILLDVRPVQ